jgi:hypothetical protein
MVVGRFIELKGWTINSSYLLVSLHILATIAQPWATYLAILRISVSGALIAGCLLTSLLCLRRAICRPSPILPALCITLLRSLPTS